MKTCLRVSYSVEPDCCGKRTISSKMGEKEERRESVRKTSCRTNGRINVATTSTKMLPELGQMVLERVIVQGKEILFIRFLDGTEIKVRI